MFKYLITHPQYLRYWLASLFSDLGQQVRNIVFLFLIYTISGHNAQAVSIMLVCEYGPVVLAPVVGVFGDRWNRKWTFVGANIGRALAVIVVLLLIPLHAAWITYVGTILGSIASLFAQSSSFAFLQEFVPQEERRQTTSLRQLVYSGMLLIGPPIATVIYSWVGLTRSLAVCCALIVTASILFSTIQGNRGIHGSMGRQLTFWRDLKQGISYATSFTLARQLLVGAVANGFVGGIINLLEIFIITQFLHLPKSMLSILLSVQGGAMLIMAPLFGRIKVRLERLLALSLVIIGLGQWLMICVAWFPLTLLGVLIEGAGISIFQISGATLQQTKIDPAFQGRFSTVNNMVVTSVMSLTMIVVGWLHAYVGVRALYLLSGLAALAISLVLYSMGLRSAGQIADEVSDSA